MRRGTDGLKKDSKPFSAPTPHAGVPFFMTPSERYKKQKDSLDDVYIKTRINKDTGMKFRDITEQMIIARRKRIINGEFGPTKEERDFVSFRDVVEIKISEKGYELERKIRSIVGAANDMRKNKKVDKKTWIDLLAWFRWNGTPVCPMCGCDRTYDLNSFQYQCANYIDCHTKFTATTGTIFSDTKLTIGHWMIAINIVTENFYLPSKQFPNHGVCTQKSGWDMIQRLKKYYNPEIRDVWLQLEYLSKVPFWDVSDSPELQETQRIIRKLNHTIYEKQHRKTK